ncbi:MAG: Ku protein [Polyangiales bacterium]
MAVRASKTTLRFGLVSIPVEVHPATADLGHGFHQLHRSCGARARQQLVCPAHGTVLQRSDLIKGYEFAKGQFVVFRDEDLQHLDEERPDCIEIAEFVPAGAVDVTHIESSGYLAPATGGGKAFELLAQTMVGSGVVAICRRYRDSRISMVRPHAGGLALHRLFFADEVRSPFARARRRYAFTPEERALADALVGQLRQECFDATKYRDERGDRIREVAEQKAAGCDMLVSSVVDDFPEGRASLRKALLQSLARRASPIRGARKAQPAFGARVRPRAR